MSIIVIFKCEISDICTRCMLYIYMHKYQCDVPVTGQKAIANDQKTQVQINHFLMGHKKAVSKWFKKHSGTPL